MEGSSVSDRQAEAPPRWSLRLLGAFELHAMPGGKAIRSLGKRERALLAYTDALVLMGGRVADGIFDEMRKHLSEEEILEFTYITALYDLHAVTTKALKLEYDDVPERIVEVAAPADAKGDTMGLIDRR